MFSPLPTMVQNSGWMPNLLAGGYHVAGRLVVQHEGELAPKIVEECGGAVLLVEGSNELRVGVAPESAAVLMDTLTIDSRIDGSVVAMNWLDAVGGEVVDG